LKEWLPIAKNESKWQEYIDLFFNNCKITDDHDDKDDVDENYEENNENNPDHTKTKQKIILSACNTGVINYFALHVSWRTKPGSTYCPALLNSL
jgi:hypothetical protein